MNKYRDKSDFEINCQVLETFEPDIKHMCLSNDERSFYHCGFDGNGFYETTIPDYCNNPADAMPIVIRSLISLISDKSDDGESAWWVAQDVTGSIASGLKSNPYRAAMICFLMIKDAEDEK